MDILRYHKVAHLLSILAIIILGLILNATGFTTYFFQDDWFVLNLVKDSNPIQLLGINNEVIYYRPLGMFYFFYFAHNAFALNSYYFHFISFAFFVGNIMLVYKLARHTFKSELSGLVSSFLFATSSTHFMTNIWLALTWNNIGLFFILLTIYIFQHLVEKRKWYLLALAFTSHVLALMSTEFAVMTPIVIVLLSWSFQRSKKFPYIFVAPLFLLSAIYTAVRLIYIGQQHVPEYGLSFGPHVLSNLFWYITWLLNIPEVFKNHISITSATFSNDPTLISPIKPYLLPIILGFLTTSALLTAMLIRYKTKLDVILFIILIISPLAPVILLENHSYTYYLAYPLVAFSLVIARLTRNVNKKLIATFLIGWLLSSYGTISFQEKTHWTTGEAAISKKIFEKVLSQSKRETSDIYVYPKSDMVINSLMDQEAFKLLISGSTTHYSAPAEGATGSNIIVNLNEI